MLGYSGFTHHRVVGDGLLEMGVTMSAACTESPVWEVFSHVLLYKTREDVEKAWDIAYPVLDKAALETFNAKLLGLYTPEFDHMFSKMPLPTVDAWKGQKFRAWQKYLAAWFEKMGATPMVIPYAETYTALATGQVKGNSGGIQAALDVKLYEVMDYVSTGWLPNMPMFVTFVNPDAWNALEPELQGILTEEADKFFTGATADYAKKSEENMAKLVDLGVTKVDVAPEELEKGTDLAREVWEKWMEETTPEAKTLMQDIMDALGYK